MPTLLAILILSTSVYFYDGWVVIPLGVVYLMGLWQAAREARVHSTERQSTSG